MDRRMFSVTPRPCRGRRISFKLPRSNGMVNCVKKLMRREISAKRDRAFTSTNAHQRFRNMHLVEEYDAHDPKALASLELPFLKLRSKVMEIVAAQDILFSLTHSGVCTAFNRETKTMICLLNVGSDEVVRSMFYNKNNDSIITVSVNASDKFTTLRCRSTRTEYIKRGQPDAGFPLFESESLKYPGFVEFDDVNGKVLTYAAQDSIYKVFDLKNYTLLYTITEKNVQEIKISPGIMLLIFNRASSHVPLKILSIEDGTVLRDFNHLLHRNKKLDFIEQFNEKLLVKQENENLQIRDVQSFEQIEVSKSKFTTPSAFIFLYENQMFLTFKDGTVSVWNFHGELVTSFDDHLLWHPDCNTNNIYITSGQDLIFSYCKTNTDDIWMEKKVGSINISNILTGKCMAKITVDSAFRKDDDELSLGKRKRSSDLRSKCREALEDVTALFYDEYRNEIYSGNHHGMIHVWSN
uniref:Transducin/WD40 repeat-like superfamily protein n=1 Tax=Kalanchoe fedtschenkoi TaxID=63787 RepID=A0A7N0RAP1_KALFE